MSDTHERTEPIALAEVDLLIGGMTCASCAARIEKRLNKLDGVTATVNYATEQAKIHAPDSVSTDDLVAQVESAGYTARPARTVGQPSGDEGSSPDEVDETLPLRNRLITSAVLAVPVILMAMVPALQFDYWQWLSLTLAAPVVTWGAWPFHRAAWLNLRHAT
ncbi:MAG: cation-translocating P-type ATPase, partial [Acidimicrobiia bacterium]|nr:cation-translocating P-type ATPase [Acidimicrobiia bacterium]